MAYLRFKVLAEFSHLVVIVVVTFDEAEPLGSGVTSLGKWFHAVLDHVYIPDPFFA